MAYSTKKWAKVKTEFETTGCSVAELVKKWGISHGSIELHISKENWKKGYLKPIIQSEIEKTMIQRFIDKGLADDDAVEVVVRMIKAEDGNIADKGLKHWEELTGKKATQKIHHTGKIDSNQKTLPVTIEDCERMLKELEADDDTPKAAN